jgi:hypothetical protein
MDVIRQAIKDDLPITQESFCKKRSSCIQGAAAKPLTQNAVETRRKSITSHGRWKNCIQSRKKRCKRAN